MIPGVLVIKKVLISKYPISIGYRVMTVGILEQNLTSIEKIWNKNDKEIHYLINLTCM
jgi:hypothetical protein